MKKVLIVEDELVIATVLKLQLVQKGFNVINVTTAEAAILKTQEFQPDFIVMDIFLKNGGNGIDTAKVIRDLKIETPIIFTTGNSYESTNEKVKDILNHHLLIKPVEFSQLEEFLKDWVYTP